MSVGKSPGRGISELVVILALIAIVIPVVMVVQGWLSGKAGNLDSMNIIQPISGYLVSRTYADGKEFITFGLRNQGQTTYHIKSFRAILTDGAVVEAQETPHGDGATLEPGSERVFVVVVATGPARVKGMIVAATEVATNRQIEVPINLG